MQTDRQTVQQRHHPSRRRPSKCVRLREIREEREMSQNDLCFLIAELNLPSHLEQTHISSIETGRSAAWPKWRTDIAIALQLSEEEVFPEYQR